MPDAIADCNTVGQCEVHRPRDRQGFRHPEAFGHGIPEGDLKRQADGLSDRHSRSLGCTHPNRNL